MLACTRSPQPIRSQTSISPCAGNRHLRSSRSSVRAPPLDCIRRKACTIRLRPLAPQRLQVAANSLSRSAGALKYLSQKYDLGAVPMTGASGGALAAVMAACRVDPDRVLQHAYDLSLAAKLWERKLGLVGIWGGLIKQWLEDLLPEDAADMCRDRVTVVVTVLPGMQQVGISDYKDREELIKVCLASVHIPFLLDYKPARRLRGKLCFDGSIPDFFKKGNSSLLTASSLLFDHHEDLDLERGGRFGMLALKSYDQVLLIKQSGYDYARKLDREGRLDVFAEAMLQQPPLSGSSSSSASRLVRDALEHDG